jgi:tetratricopeptide (TPR) repeat protein
LFKLLPAATAIARFDTALQREGTVAIPDRGVASVVVTSSEDFREKFLYAVEQYNEGHLVEAEKTYRHIAAIAPDHAVSIHNLGLVLFQRGNLDEAISMYRRAVAIASNYHEAYNDLGVALEIQGRLDDAYEAYNHAIALKPDYAAAYNNLGDVLRKGQRLAEAEGMYEIAARLDPGNVLAHINLGTALWGQRRTLEAEEAFTKAVRINPNHPDAHYNLGRFLADQGRLQDSEVAFRQALFLRPDFAEAYDELGIVLGFLGRMHEAEDAIRHAIWLKPTLTRAYWDLAAHHKYDSTDHEDVGNIRQQLQSTSLKEADAMNLHYALGKIYDDCKEYDKAFSHIDHANRIRRRTTSFDREGFSGFVSRMIAAFDSKAFSPDHTLEESSRIPVFIVGMPRSGTTLVEQIIDSHPDAWGIGESTAMRDVVDRLTDSAAGVQAYPECVKSLDRETAGVLARNYQRAAYRDVDERAVRVTDKTPSNFLHLGLIALLFPHARIVHCCRSPLDTCLSIFFHNFSGVTEAAYDLSDIGFYYIQYRRLMTHWQRNLPLKMIEVQYESLVSDFTFESHRLVEFLDLDWDFRCATFYLNPRGVATSSSWQVRQPIFSTSVQRWRNYSKHLGPLVQSLGIKAEFDANVEKSAK